MRTIKFRAWEHNLNEIIPVDDIQFYRGDDIEIEGIKLKPKPRDEQPIIINTRSAWRIADGEDVSLMQFTGLLDKNGKEIYEGDLVTIRQNGHISTIEFTDGCFMMVHKHKDLSGVENGGYEQVLGFLAVPVEVIGNIYENPGLLK